MRVIFVGLVGVVVVVVVWILSMCFVGGFLVVGVASEICPRSLGS